MAELVIDNVKSIVLQPVVHFPSTGDRDWDFDTRHIVITDDEGNRTVISMLGSRGGDPSALLTSDEQKAAKELCQMDAYCDEEEAAAAYRDQLEDAAAKQASLPVPF